MSQYSEELRAKVREALLVRARAFNDAYQRLINDDDLVELVENLSVGVAAAIDRADTEAWLFHDEYWGADDEAHLNRILDALKDQ